MRLFTAFSSELSRGLTALFSSRTGHPSPDRIPPLLKRQVRMEERRGTSHLEKFQRDKVHSPCGVAFETELGFTWARYTDIKGKRRRSSTGTPIKSKADTNCSPSPRDTAVSDHRLS